MANGTTEYGLPNTRRTPPNHGWELVGSKVSCGWLVYGQVYDGKRFRYVYLADKTLREEEWRKSKILAGSLLCSSADIQARCIRGNIAFGSFCLQWPSSRVTNDTLYKVCNTEPLSVNVEKLRRSLLLKGDLKRRGLGPPTIEKKLKRAREAEDTVERDEERLNAATGHFHTTVDAEHNKEMETDSVKKPVCTNGLGRLDNNPNTVEIRGSPRRSGYQAI
ncbi:hypothetical protein Bbelb_436670 [Branchiostoma belcheri]|nr:hypothetical protein Bbelb_436670 [Branchiostoma belcheri]